MLIKKYVEINKTLDKLHKDLTGDKLDPTNTYIFYENKKLIGYTVLIPINNNTIKIDWFYGPGKGKLIYAKLEQKLKKDKIKQIQLNLSIDPNENKDTVMRRINFWFGLEFRVRDIEFRKKFGP